MRRTWAWPALAGEPSDIWQEMVAASRHLPMTEMSPNLIHGFLVELGQRDRVLTELLLEAVLDDPQLVAMFPELQGSISYDRAALGRLHRCLLRRPGPVTDFAVLGSALRGLVDDGNDLLQLLREIVTRAVSLGDMLAMHEEVFRGAVRKLQADMQRDAADARLSESRAARESGGRFE